MTQIISHINSADLLDDEAVHAVIFVLESSLYELAMALDPEMFDQVAQANLDKDTGSILYRYAEEYAEQYPFDGMEYLYQLPDVVLFLLTQPKIECIVKFIRSRKLVQQFFALNQEARSNLNYLQSRIGDRDTYIKILEELLNVIGPDFAANPGTVLNIYREIGKYDTLLERLIELEERELFGLALTDGSTTSSNISKELEEFIHYLWKKDRGFDATSISSDPEIQNLKQLASILNNFRVQWRVYLQEKNEGEFLSKVRELNYLQSFHKDTPFETALLACISLHTLAIKQFIERQTKRRGLGGLQEVIREFKAEALMLQKRFTQISSSHQRVSGVELQRLLTITKQSLANILSV